MPKVDAVARGGWTREERRGVARIEESKTAALRRLIVIEGGEVEAFGGNWAAVGMGEAVTSGGMVVVWWRL